MVLLAGMQATRCVMASPTRVVDISRPSPITWSHSVQKISRLIKRETNNQQQTKTYVYSLDSMSLLSSSHPRHIVSFRDYSRRSTSADKYNEGRDVVLVHKIDS